MSCEKGINKFGGLAAARTGISQAGSKVGNVVGRLAGPVGQTSRQTIEHVARTSDAVTEAAGSRIGPICNQLVTAVDRPTTVAANLAPALITAASLTRVRVYTTDAGQATRPAVGVMVALREAGQMARNLKTIGRVRGQLQMVRLAGSLAGRLALTGSQKPGEPRRLARTEKGRAGHRQVSVGFSQTRLTGWLNRSDLLLSPRQVVSSQGDLVHSPSGGNWHRGTTVVKTSQGERTITHLRSLTLPATSFYFDRPLSDAETADLVTGQTKAHRLAGYAGTIGEMENLAPAWAQTKRALILTRLHWPEPAPEASWTVQASTEESQP